MSSQHSSFSEHDIRPENLIAGQIKAISADIEKLLSREAQFVKVPCPACGQDSPQPKFQKNGFSYVDCRNCETFYVSPRPTPQILADFLSHSENYAYWGKYIFPASVETRREKIFKPRVERVIELVQKYNLGTDALLEVGAGFGLFCEEMNKKKIFKRVVAVEPSPELAKISKERGVEIIDLPIEQVTFPDNVLFDVVVNFEVIEHLFSPKEFILQCKKFLKPGGLLILTCPNGRGFDVEVLGTVSDTVDHEHLNYFNPKSLSALLSSCDFEVIESLTPGTLDADLVRNKILAGAYDVSGQPFLKKILIDEWETLGVPFQDFLASNKLSSNMWVICREPVNV